MTMRAPSLASLAAVAAPRPEADPVITTHIPSLAIWISFCCRVPSFRGAAPLARRTRNPEASHEAGFRVRAEEARPGMTLWAIYHIGRREQVGLSPLRGKSANGLSLHVAFAGQPADIGACQRRRFSPSWPEQKAKRGTLWRRVRISYPRPRSGFLPTS